MSDSPDKPFVLRASGSVEIEFVEQGKAGNVLPY